MLPAIVAVNNAVLGERARLQIILRDVRVGISLSPRDQAWIAQDLDDLLDGGLLLRHLTRYSELGGDYVEQVTVVTR